MADSGPDLGLGPRVLLEQGKWAVAPKTRTEALGFSVSVGDVSFGQLLL